jgi:hypothetical protein
MKGIAMNHFCKSILTGLAAGALTAVLHAGAFAAQSDKNPDDQGKPQHHMMDQDHEAKFREHFAKRTAELHDKLKLNANQEAAWKTYIAAITPPPRPPRPDHAEWKNLSAPERMERMLNHMKEAEGRMSNALAATKTFYATLTPEQQKIFNDNVGMGPMHRHHHDHDGNHGPNKQ